MKTSSKGAVLHSRPLVGSGTSSAFPTDPLSTHRLSIQKQSLVLVSPILLAPGSCSARGVVLAFTVAHELRLRINKTWL